MKILLVSIIVSFFLCFNVFSAYQDTYESFLNKVYVKLEKKYPNLEERIIKLTSINTKLTVLEKKYSSDSHIQGVLTFLTVNIQSKIDSLIEKKVHTQEVVVVTNTDLGVRLTIPKRFQSEFKVLGKNPIRSIEYGQLFTAVNEYPSALPAVGGERLEDIGRKIAKEENGFEDYCDKSKKSFYSHMGSYETQGIKCDYYKTKNGFSYIKNVTEYWFENENKSVIVLSYIVKNKNDNFPILLFSSKDEKESILNIEKIINSIKKIDT